MRKSSGVLFITALTLGLLTTANGWGKSVAPAAAPELLAPAAPPRGKGKFMGAHPLAGRLNAGYCYIDVPHTHDYLPDRPTLFQQAGDGYVFTGDPVPFGYEGEKTVFYGHHPVPLNVEPVATDPVPAGPPSTFCFMKGPHYHEYPQPKEPGFTVKDNVVFYVGPIPPPAAAVRPQLERTLEVEYRPYVAMRPQVVVTPPQEWQGVVWVAPPPRQVVVAPPPTVIVTPPPPIVVAPPIPTVIIGAPAPPVIIMGGRGKGKGWKGGKGWGHYGWKGKGRWKH